MCLKEDEKLMILKKKTWLQSHSQGKDPLIWPGFKSPVYEGHDSGSCEMNSYCRPEVDMTVGVVDV